MTLGRLTVGNAPGSEDVKGLLNLKEKEAIQQARVNQLQYERTNAKSQWLSQLVDPTAMFIGGIFGQNPADYDKNAYGGELEREQEKLNAIRAEKNRIYGAASPEVKGYMSDINNAVAAAIKNRVTGSNDPVLVPNAYGTGSLYNVDELITKSAGATEKAIGDISSSVSEVTASVNSAIDGINSKINNPQFSINVTNNVDKSGNVTTTATHSPTGNSAGAMGGASFLNKLLGR